MNLLNIICSRYDIAEKNIAYLGLSNNPLLTQWKTIGSDLLIDALLHFIKGTHQYIKQTILDYCCCFDNAIY